MKPVFAYDRYNTFQDTVGSNFVEILTIDLGSGNAGAVGIRFVNSNNGAIDHVTIRSSDPGHACGAGIFFRNGNVQGLYKNITVDGCDYGIDQTPHASDAPAYEYLTLKNQLMAGFNPDNGVAGIRKSFILTNNGIPAVQETSSTAMIILLDDVFASTSQAPIAVQDARGILFARNITTPGYSTAIQVSTTSSGTTNLPGPHVSEFASAGYQTLFPNQALRSLNLPVEETPEVPWEENLKEWANVKDYGAKGNGAADDTLAIQAALNSGKDTIYFPGGRYVLSATVTVPSTISHINFVFSDLKVVSPIKNSTDGVFRIVATDSDRTATPEPLRPLVMEDAYI